MNINDFFHVPVLSFPPQVCLSRLKFVHLLSVEIDCEQSLLFFRFSDGSAGALECRGKKWGRQPERKNKKRVSFWCLSYLTPSVTRVVICVSHTFCSTDQEKRETATAESSFYMKLSQGLITYNAIISCLFVVSPFSHLPSHGWSFACLTHFARQTKEKERLLLQRAHFIWSWVRVSSLTMHASATVVLWKGTLKALMTLK